MDRLVVCSRCNGQGIVKEHYNYQVKDKNCDECEAEVSGAQSTQKTAVYIYRLECSNLVLFSPSRDAGNPLQGEMEMSKNNSQPTHHVMPFPSPSPRLCLTDLHTSPRTRKPASSSSTAKRLPWTPALTRSTRISWRRTQGSLQRPQGCHRRME